MATQQIAHHREEAEIYHGEALCKQKSRLLLDQILLPRGLLPLDEILEMGYNRTTGFVWLKQKHKKEHRFQAIGRTVSYEAEVTAFVEEHRMRRVTGVKSKELFIWVTISEIFVDDPNSGKITFANPTGIARSFPLSAFHLQEHHNKVKINDSVKEKGCCFTSKLPFEKDMLCGTDVPCHKSPSFFRAEVS